MRAEAKRRLEEEGPTRLEIVAGRLVKKGDALLAHLASRRLVSKTGDDLFQAVSDLARDGRQFRILYRLHRGNRVDGGDLHASLAGFLKDDIAGQHGSDLVLALQRLVRKRRVARPEDHIRAKVDTQLLLHRRTDVDRRQNAEALRGQRVNDMLDGLIEGHFKCLAKIVAHGSLSTRTVESAGGTGHEGSADSGQGGSASRRS